MQMTFLQLVNRLIQECGITAQPLTSLSGLTGELNRCKDWINTAWVEIQSIHQDWQWMRTSGSFTTVDGKPSYSLVDISITDFGMWDKNTFRNYDTTIGLKSEITMGSIPYALWRDRYMLGALRDTRSRPIEMSIGPDKSIFVGPYPIAGYTVTGDYYRCPSEMANDADVPAMPGHFHMAIVYLAMTYYGMFEAAPEVLNRGTAKHKSLMSLLAIDRLPEIGVGGALA